MAITSATIDVSALKVAGDGASKYITSIDSNNGIQVHAQNNTDINYVQINASGMEIFNTDGASTNPSAISVAQFGTTTRIGTTTTLHVEIDADSFDIRDESNMLARFDRSKVAFYNENEITLAEFGSSGATIGAEEATSRAKFTSDGFEIEDDNLLTIVKMGKGETLWNHYKESVYIGRVVANAKEDENDE